MLNKRFMILPCEYGGKNMPVITIDGPKMSKEQKSKLVAAYANICK